MSVLICIILLCVVESNHLVANKVLLLLYTKPSCIVYTVHGCFVSDSPGSASGIYISIHLWYIHQARLLTPPRGYVTPKTLATMWALKRHPGLVDNMYCTSPGYVFAPAPWPLTPTDCQASLVMYNLMDMPAGVVPVSRVTSRDLADLQCYKAPYNLTSIILQVIYTH